MVVLGGGPAGLTAGYLLAKQGKAVIVLESTDQVGGIARTEVRDGYRFDLGGHRFFTKVKEVDDLWHEIMKEEFLKRPRQCRIYWNDKFLEYPLQGMDVIRKLGPVELTRCWSPTCGRRSSPRAARTRFEQWVSNRFGKRLYNHFFKTYTEKLWGVPTAEIRAEWAAQRIKGLSFFAAAKAAFFGNKGNKIKSLISEFNYPRYGPGQMWEQMTADIHERGGEVRLNAPVTRCSHRERARDRGRRRRRDAQALIRDLVAAAAEHGRDRRAGSAGRGSRRRSRPALPRLPDGFAGDRGDREPVPRQLDLHPPARRARATDPELPVVEPVDGAQ